MTRARRRTLLGLAALGAASPGAAYGAAPPPVVVAVEPASGETASFFAFEARPGHTIRPGRLVLRNVTARRVRVNLDPVDALTATTLGSAYQARGLRTHGPTRWTVLPRRSVVLPPHGRVPIGVVVRVPGNARSGDYLSGIGIQARVPPRVTKLRSNVGVASLQRYVVGVEVKVPGPRRPKIVFTGARVERQPSGTIFLLEARNRGNVILQSVRGAATVSRGGRRVARAVIGPGTFVTRSAIDYPVPARAEQPREGDVYRVRATMRYRGGIARLDQRVRFGRKQAVAQEHFGGPPARSERSSSSWLPWTIGAAALAALGAAFAALIRRRRRTDGLTLVSRALEAASRTGEPVSVTAIGADGLDQRARKALAAAVRPRLRRADTLAELEKEGLVVVSPDTGPDAAAGLAAELRRSLASVEGVRVGSATAQHPVEAAQLLGRARDAAHGPLPSVHTKSTR